MRLVSAAKYAALKTQYERVVRQRDSLQDTAAKRLSTITRQAEEITRLRDQQPTSPVREPRPVQGDAELRRQLMLAARAVASLTQQLADLQASHEADTRELRELRQGATS
jgi:uncharacterized coiled-coil DUF342 family protein